jgi:PAS domain S-box-containing protein
MAESRVVDRTAGKDLREHRRGQWLLLTGFVVLATAIAGLAYWAWTQQAQSLTTQSERTLNAVANLKAAQLAAWTAERRSNAELIRTNRLLSAAVTDMLAGRDVAASALRVRSYLAELQRHFQYEDVVLFAPDGRAIMTVPATAHHAAGRVRALVAEAQRSRQVISSDLYRGPDGVPRIDMVAPVLAQRPADPPVACVALHIDPLRFLYPFIQQWPLPGTTGETLLVERQGDRVLYLNELRFRKGTALRMSISANRTSLPAAMAVHGRRGIVEGVDYRGVPVMAAIAPVPTTHWYVVAKIDRSEVLDPIRRRGWLTAGFTLLVVALGAAGALMLWRARERQAHADLVASEARYRTLVEHLPQRIFLKDAQLRWKSVNQNFADDLGIDPADVIGKTDYDLFPKELADKYQEDDRRIMETGVPEEIEERTILDERETWVNTVKTPVMDEDGAVAGVLGVFWDVTERKRAEEILRDSEARLRAVLDAAPFPVALVDVDDNAIDYWSSSALALFGHTAPTAEEWYRLAYPDPAYRQEVIDRWRPFLESARSSGETVNTGEYLVTCADGSVLVCELYATFVADRLVVTFDDVTERRRATEDLRANEERLRFLVDQTPTVNWTLDRELRFTLSRGAGLEALGLKPDEVLGMYVGDYLGGQGPQADLGVAMHRRALDGQTFAYEQPVGDLTFDILVGPLRDADGGIVGVIGVAYDATARKEADEARREAERRLAQANVELEQRVADRTAELDGANKELEAFAYSVSHDLRAPLRHISGSSNLLAERAGDQLDEKSRHYVDVISTSVRQMGVLIDDLLQFSRTGRAELVIGRVDMQATLEEALEPLRRETDGRHVEWSIGELPPVVADRALLRQVWANLVGNAVKYTRGRSPAKIEIGAAGVNGEVVFFVRDNGVGFDMQYAHKLFGVFQRLHTDAEFEGTGIGLANVKRIVTRLGGAVWAEGEPDQGATFYFSLPNRQEATS